MTPSPGRQADILEIARSLGAVLKRVSGPEYAGPCLICGGRDRFSVNTKKRVWHCRGCGIGGDVISLVVHVAGVGFIEAVKRLTGETLEPNRRPKPVAGPVGHTAGPWRHDRADEDEALRRNLRIAAQIVAELVPIADTPGELYLRDVRKIDVDTIDDVLGRTDAIGWHPAVYFSEHGHALHGRKLGAIIGVMSDPITTKPTGAISRTYITNETKIGKAKTLGTPAGIVRLTPDDEVETGLHLCEGLESGLAAMSLGFRPLWATGSTSLMRTFPVLDGIECLTILADRDENGAGEEAAREAARRWREAGRETSIKRLNKSRSGDINDALREST